MDVHGPECKGKFILQIGCCIKKVLFCFRIAVLNIFFLSFLASIVIVF